jgi:RimJ/RimL family protein N-acetyltransferase
MAEPTLKKISKKGMAIFPHAMKTPRTILRPITIDDAGGWKRFNNRIVARMPRWPGAPSVVYARNEILHLIDMAKSGEEYTYSILDRASGDIIGDFHIKNIDREKRMAEFGHALDPTYWGTGVTYETIAVVHRAAKRRGYWLWCAIEEGNIRSWKSIEKYGARLRGKRALDANGQKKTVRIYDL